MISLDTGDIYEIKMEHNLGYAYFKYTWLDSGYREVQMIQFFDLFTSQSAEKLKEKMSILEKLEQTNFITNRILIQRYPPTRGKYKVKKIGNLPVSERETHFPDFKMSGGKGSIQYNENEADVPMWVVIKNAYPNLPYNGEYKKINHLQTWASDPWDSQFVRITMLYLKKQGLNIHDYYEIHQEYQSKEREYLDEQLKLKLMLHWVNNSIFYYDIPEDIREKMIE